MRHPSSESPQNAPQADQTFPSGSAESYVPKITLSTRGWQAFLARHYYRLNNLKLLVTFLINIILLSFTVSGGGSCVSGGNKTLLVLCMQENSVLCVHNVGTVTVSWASNPQQCVSLHTTLFPSFKLLHLDTSSTLSIMYGGDTTCMGPIIFEAAVCPPLCALSPAHHVLLESEGTEKAYICAV